MEIQEVVPPATQLDLPVSRETCGEVLGALRSRGTKLTPAPDELIHEAAEAWLSHAEHMFFDCFDTETPAASISDGYAALERLGAQVDAALMDADRPRP